MALFHLLGVNIVFKVRLVLKLQEVVIVGLVRCPELVRVVGLRAGVSHPRSVGLVGEPVEHWLSDGVQHAVCKGAN